jgi:hypothetical protein
MPTPGHVYILMNPSHKLLKIGKTIKAPEDRAAELSSQTGIVAPFIVCHSKEVSDCDLGEKLIHSELAKFRVNDGREFFAVSLEEAIGVVTEIAKAFPPNKNGLSEVVPTQVWRENLSEVKDQKSEDAARHLFLTGWYTQQEAYGSVQRAIWRLGKETTVAYLVRNCLDCDYKNYPNPKYAPQPRFKPVLPNDPQKM